MIRLQEIKEALYPLVGWRQGPTPELQISSDLQVSESGLYYDGAHPLVTLANIASVQAKQGGAPIFPGANLYPADPEVLTFYATITPYKRGEIYAYGSALYRVIKDFEGGAVWPPQHPEYFSVFETYTENYESWDATHTYQKDDLVFWVMAYYKSKTNNNTGNHPAQSPNSWELYTPADKWELVTITWFANYQLENALDRYLEDGIATMVNRFLMDKQLARETRSLLERRTFFDGAARLQSTIEPTGKLCGFQIVPVRSMGVTTKIERIGLQMLGNTGAVTMYLFHSSQVAPMKVISLNYTNTSGGFQWFTPAEETFLPYIADGNDSGGAWLLCYNQNDLPTRMRALNVSKDWSKEPCATCSGYSLESWKEITKYLQVSPFCTQAPEGFKDDPQMPDIADLAFTNTMNYGINVEISIRCDLTDFIVSQKYIFAPVLQKQVAANVLRELAMNPDVRVNRNQANVTRDGILYELDGNPQGRAGGLVYDLERQYKALSLDTRGLDRICLQCNNGGVKYRAV